MSDEGRLFKGRMKILWNQLKRYMTSTSYPLPRLPFYQNVYSKYLFKIIFSNLVGSVDLICILVNTGLISSYEESNRGSLAKPSVVLTMIFCGLSGLKLLIIRWHRLFERRLVFLQVSIATASIVILVQQARVILV